MEPNNKRRILPKLAELIDLLTIYQIKETLLPKRHREYANYIENLIHDIDLLIRKKRLNLSAKLIRMIVILAQLNLHIWQQKDKMKNPSEDYEKSLKLAHQLNGLRNQIKNKLLEEFGDEVLSGKHTNVETDSLKDWKISLK